jgi:DNA-binding NtrC family response regulator
MSDQRVLLIEDTLSMQLVYQTILEKAGNLVDVAATAQEGEALFISNSYGVVVLDLGLPDGDGIDVMRRLIESSDDVKVVVVTANGSLNKAVEAMRVGAFDFLVKPISDTRLLSSVENAFSQKNRQISKKKNRQTSSYDTASQMDEIQGTSSAIAHVRRRIMSIAQSTATVFLTGESGTGKEVCAHVIHRESNRADDVFEIFDCGSFLEADHEQILFGSRDGKITGLLERVNFGTILISDICMLSLSAQAALLRFLQTSSIGDGITSHRKKLDVRIVCATKFDPVVEVEEKRFREDLFYVLHVVPVHLPPLRQRQRDVLEIAQTILQKIAVEGQKPTSIMSPAVEDALLHHPLPGNLQQLQSVLDKADLLADGRTIELHNLGLEFLASLEDDSLLRFQQAIDGKELSASEEISITIEKLVGLSLSDIEVHVIKATIKKYDGSVVKAAEVLRVAPSTLYRKLEQWKLLQ